MWKPGGISDLAFFIGMNTVASISDKTFQHKRQSLVAMTCFVCGLLLAPVAAKADVFQVGIATANDDAEQSLSNGSMYLGSEPSSSGFLELGYYVFRRDVGLRFQNVTIPQGSTINSAVVAFTAAASKTTNTRLTVTAEAADNAAAFTSAAYNISSRSTTAFKVDWNVPNWSSGNTYQTVDFSAAIQEVVSRSGWASGNSMVVIVGPDTACSNSNCDRVAEEYESGAGTAARLIIDYTPPTAAEHFAISHDGVADTCNAESITISKHDAAHAVDTAYTGTITLSTSTGNGNWSLISGAGTLVNSGGGSASYSYAAGDAGQVVLGLSNSVSETLNINVTDGGITELGSEDADLIFAGAVSETYSDTFASTSYSRNDGSQNWAGSWSEIGDGGGANGGDVNITTDQGSGRLHLQDRNNSIWREVDLSAYTGATATLSFDYRRVSLDNSNDYVTISIYNGSTWLANLDTFAGPATDGSYQSASYDISSYMTANTRIRFSSSNAMNNGDDFYIDNVQIAVASSAVCPGIDHFVLSHDGLGINCLAEPVSVAAIKSDGTTDTSYTGTIVLDTQTGTGSWSLGSGNGVFSDATAGDGIATYTFASADNGVASFNLDYQSGAASINVDVYEGATRDDDTEGNLVFSPNGFVVTANPLSNPPPGTINTAIPAQTAATNFNLYLAAYGQTPSDPVCGIIEAYDGVKNLAFWFSYDDPATGTRLLTVNGNNAATSEGAAGTQGITFNSGQAVIALNYTDVGRLSLFMKDDTVTIDLPTGIRGVSDAFVVKPAGFVLSSIQRSSDGFPNPAAAGAAGAAFVQAGEAFSVTVTAVNSAGNATPNYGQESTPEGVLLTPTIVSAGGVNNPAIGFTSGFGSFSNGVATGTDFYWDEVGIITLSPSVADADYLGSGDVAGTSSGNVGRFYPSYFTTAVSGGSLANTCSTATPFTYIGESFAYGSNPTVTVTAKSAIGNTVQNYSGSYAKLTSGGLSLIYPAADNSQLDQGGVNPIAVNVSVGGMSRTDNADGSLAFALGGASADVFAYERSLGLVDPFNADLTIALTAASDGEASAADLGAPKAISPTGNLQRFGRATALDVTSPYTTLGLTQVIPVSVQYYSAGAWVDNTDDSCSSFTYTQADDGITTSITPASAAPVNAGAGDLTVQLDADAGDPGGRTIITFGWDAWLLYDLDGVDQLSDGNLYDDSFASSVTFGAFRGDDRFLYWRE